MHKDRRTQCLGGESLKIERKDDLQTMEHVITITLTCEEMVRASDEMTPAEKQTTYLMSQSSLLEVLYVLILNLLVIYGHWIQMHNPNPLSEKRYI